MSNRGTVVHWFRKGLRLHDNPALLAAIEGVNGENFELRPIFILDPVIGKKLQVGPNRWRFLQQSLHNLDTNLRAIGTRLYVVRGKPEEVFDRLFDQWKVKCLTFESDIEPYARERDSKVEKLAKAAGVKVVRKVTHTLYPPEVIIAKNLGLVPMTYQKFLSVVEKVGAPRQPCPAPTELPLACRPSELGISDEELGVPTLEELGVEETELGPCLYPGGETEALSRMERYMSDQKYICMFEKPKTSPTSIEPSTTVLSPYLKFGCLSVSKFYYALQKVITGAKHTQPPVSLKGQIMWREFYYTVASDTPNFDKMEGNKICTQIPWSNKKEYLEAWTWGRTGYPWIDAVMTQLRQEGWIHHLARHAVACFLTRGDLWVSWEEGQKVFEELLLDADWALNAGNWMWLSASAFFRQFFRVYSPVVFPKKTDSTGEYVRKYIPALRKLPAEYIYEPWTAPKDVLEEAGCVLGVDYPKRIVIHNVVYKKNIVKMSKAYKANKANMEKPIKNKRKIVHSDNESEEEKDTKEDSDTVHDKDSNDDDDDEDDDSDREQKMKSKTTSKKSRSQKSKKSRTRK